MLKSSKWDMTFCWLFTLTLGVGIAWPQILESLTWAAGLQAFAHSKYAVFMWSAVFVGALWLSMPRWHTRDRLLIFVGISGCLAILGGFFFSLVFGMMFAAFCTVAGRMVDRRDKIDLEARRSQ